MKTRQWCDQQVSSLKFACFSWLAHRLPTCEEVLKMISRDMDSPISLTQKIKMKLHNYICEWCQRYQDQLRLMRHAMRNEDPAVPLSGENSLSSEARERLKRSFNQ